MPTDPTHVSSSSSKPYFKTNEVLLWHCESHNHDIILLLETIEKIPWGILKMDISAKGKCRAYKKDKKINIKIPMNKLSKSYFKDYMTL